MISMKRKISSATDAFMRGIKSLNIPVEWDGKNELVLTGSKDEVREALETLREFDPDVSMMLDIDKSEGDRKAYYTYWEGGDPVDYEYDFKKGGFKIKSARFIVEDEFGEVIGSADTYEEAETMGGARIIDGEKIQSSKRIASSEIGDVHDDYVLGNISEDGAFYRLEKLVGMEKAEDFINKWKNKRVVSSSVEKAVSEAEDYFGTIASDDTVTSQDVITYKDGLEMQKIADKNDVKVKVGRFSVTFHDDDFEKFGDMIHRD